MTARILIGDVRAALRSLPADSVQCVVTYWGLRSYLPDDHPSKTDELGLEATPDEYIAKMVAVFAEVRRVLRPDGTLWLNIGDSYCTSPRGNRPGDTSTSTLDSPGYQEEKQRPRPRTARDIRHTPKPSPGADGPSHDPKWPGARDRKPGRPNRSLDYGLKHKDMVGIPWMLAFALRADGWWLRADIIWHKPNPMPESVTDRPTKSHEYLFLLTKAPQYFYDAAAIRELALYGDHPRNGTPDLADIQAPGQPRQSGLTKLRRAGNKGGPPVGHSMAGGGRGPTDGSRSYRDRKPENAKTFRGGGAYTHDQAVDNDAEVARDSSGNEPNEAGTRNSRSVWTIATHPFPEAHFATFPPALAERCILAGTSAMGCCRICAAPRRRVEEVAYVNPGNRTTNGPRSTERRHETAGFEVRLEREAETVGWEATCECPETTLGAGTEWAGLGTVRYPGCTVLDPFNGAGTAGMVALRLQRRYIGIDLYDQYGEMAVKRIVADAPLLNRARLERVGALNSD